MRMDKTTGTLLLAAGMIAAFGCFFPRPQGHMLALGSRAEWIINTGMDEERFYTRKAGWPAEKLDMLIAGDSRIYRGVSPAEMGKLFPGWRIRNFGFSSGSYSALFMNAIERLVDPASSNRVIVLGITPYSLTGGGMYWNQFNEEIKRRRTEVWERLFVQPALTFFKPLTLRELERGLKGQLMPKGIRYYQRFEADGWVASHKDPEDPEEAFSEYVSNFRKNPVVDRYVEDLVTTTRSWTAKGIRVFAFRPPTTDKMVELENRLSGFNETDLVRRLASSGVVWIPTANARYHSYDGSHLDETSALRFSRDLAIAIQAHLNKANQPAL